MTSSDCLSARSGVSEGSGGKDLGTNSVIFQAELTYDEALTIPQAAFSTFVGLFDKRPNPLILGRKKSGTYHQGGAISSVS